MEKLIEPRVLGGFRDFLPADEIERKRIRNLLEKTFGSFGFVPIDTPVLEYAEVLLGKGGGETEKQVYRFADNGGRDIAMRYDLTVPFARFMAAHRNELYLPFKRYHIDRVWRGEKAQKGRYREFVQCDFDIVGTDSFSSDFEILMLIRASFIAMNVDNFTIRISHRGIFNRFLEKLSIKDKSVEILRIVDKLTKIGRDKVKELLSGVTSAENADLILEYITPGNDFETTLASMERLAGGAADDTGRLAELRKLMIELGIEQSYMLDPSITRGLDYYTGLVFETFLQDIPTIGSVCSGGRYNDLAGLYTKENLPGVGGSIGLDRLIAALEELGKKPVNQGSTDVLIFCLDESLIGTYHRIANNLRSSGFSVEVFPESRKLAQQFAFAEKRGIPVGVFLGSNEAENGTISLKNLVSRESLDCKTEAEAAAKITDWIGRKG